MTAIECGSKVVMKVSLDRGFPARLQHHFFGGSMVDFDFLGGSVQERLSRHRSIHTRIRLNSGQEYRLVQGEFHRGCPFGAHPNVSLAAKAWCTVRL